MDIKKNEQDIIAELKRELEETRQKLENEIVTRLEIENRLGKALSLSQTILEKMPVGVIIVDRHRIIKRLNRTAMEMMNIKSSSEVVGRTCHLFICPREHGECPIIDLEEDIHQCETQLLGPGGYVRQVLKTVIPIELDKESVLLEVFVDIAQRKKQEEELRVLSRAIEQSPSSIVITDTNGQIEYVNPAFTKTTGYTFTEAIGKNPRILKDPDKKSEEYKELWDTLTSKKVWMGEFHNVKKNGDYYWERAAIGPVLDENDVITHYVAVKEDITERKKAEDALKISEQQLREANVTKDKLFSIIAHDLRNAFNVVLSGCTLLAKRIENIDKERIAAIAQALSKTTENTNDLLENLLTWSRLQMNTVSMEPQALTLVDIVQKNFNLFAEVSSKKGITLVHSIASGVQVFADSNMLNTVLRNLIHNAIKFTQHGGKVEVFISPAEDDDDVEIHVSDTGIGINAEHLSGIFNVDSDFKSRGTEGEGGTGIGLPLCKDFIEKNGGNIWVESEPGAGSTFIFTLPKCEK